MQRYAIEGPDPKTGEPGTLYRHDVLDEEACVGFINEAKMDGHRVFPSPLDWLNRAQIVLDPDEDAVKVYVSVGDPRGALAFTVRRIPDGPNAGRLIIGVPHPNEGQSHVDLVEAWPGTLNAPGVWGEHARINRLVRDLTREQCESLLGSVCIACDEDESLETLREAVEANLRDFTLDLDDAEALV